MIRKFFGVKADLKVGDWFVNDPAPREHDEIPMRERARVIQLDPMWHVTSSGFETASQMHDDDVLTIWQKEVDA